jgi:predicted Fe-Mo cluster-binding NifX family protein
LIYNFLTKHIQQIMKVLIAAKGEGWDARVSDRFGRAPGFSLYDSDTGELKWYSNEENLNAEHGVGIQAAQTAVSLKAGMVITGGNFGPKASEVLQRTGAKMIDYAGDITVKQAVEKYVK